MLKVVNGLLVIALLVAAFTVYSLEYSIKQGEREIAAAKAKARETRETMKLLDAEWSMLSRPERLQRLADEYLELKPQTAVQTVDASQLKAQLKPRPPFNPAQAKEDPIAKMLEGLGR